MRSRFIILAACGAALISAPQALAIDFFGLGKSPEPKASAGGKATSASPQPGEAPVGWRIPDPENIWILQTNQGRIIAELSPSLAPISVARIKQLTRAHFYDGLKFFRVVDDFIDQTGDPANTGNGASALPDVPPEFTMRRNASMSFFPLASIAGYTGFMNAMPVLTQPDAQMGITADGAVQTTGLFCAGVLGMARGQQVGSANSQFFFMRSASSSLNGTYTPFGRVIAGLDVVRKIKVGEPPEEPMDVLVKAQILADIPAAERPKILVMDTAGPTFAAYLANWRKTQLGTGVDICNLDIPAAVQ